MKLSMLFPETRDIRVVRELAVRSEEQGFHGMWLGAAFGFDPVMALALAGDATSSIQLGVAVLPTWPRHPIVTAQQAATASAATGGRFRLGLGPSHEPVMSMYGIPFDRPISHLREYLEIVRALLADGQVSHQGDRYQVTGFLDVADAPVPPVLLGVLREQTARLAGAVSDGALCWLAPAPYLRDVVGPNLEAGSTEVGRDTPPFIAELPCALGTDREALHAMAASDLGIYPQMPFYRAMFKAAGVPLDKGRWTDEMLDAAVIHGDEDQIAAKVGAFFEAGADEVVLSPFGLGDDPAGSQQDCIRILSDLAKG